MTDFTVHFEGICTHVLLPRPTDDGVVHRTVLVNAQKPVELFGEQMVPHIGYLVVPTDSIIVPNDLDLLGDTFVRQADTGECSVWRLSGVRIRILNEAADAVVPQGATGAPSLTRLADQDFGLNEDVVYGSDAACHFDITRGTFHTTTDGLGAWRVALSVPVADEHVMVEITRLDDPTGVSGTLELSAPSSIGVSNVCDGSDKPYDFYLHYLIADPLPAKPGMPSDVTPVTTDATATRPAGSSGPTFSFELGPGCSNSNYP